MISRNFIDVLFIEHIVVVPGWFAGAWWGRVSGAFLSSPLSVRAAYSSSSASASFVSLCPEMLTNGDEMLRDRKVIYVEMGNGTPAKVLINDNFIANSEQHNRMNLSLK